jgi:hypothetical protein
MPWRAWAHGEELTAGLVRSHLQDQMILQFPSTTARDAAIPASRRVAGMLAVTTDAMTLWYWTGSLWKQVVPGTLAWNNFFAPLDGPPVVNVLGSDVNVTSSTASPIITVGGATNATFIAFGVVVFSTSGSMTAITVLQDATTVTVQPRGTRASMLTETLADLYTNDSVSVTGAVTQMVMLRGVVSFQNNASTWGLYAARSPSGTLTIRAGTWLMVWRVG